jgi:hypothetical protein
MKNKRFLRNGFSLLILILLTQQHLIAQTTIITGRIKNQKDDSAIQGATVKLKNGKSATVSDTNGYFQLNATSSTKNIIIISFVGFRSQELAVKDGQTIQVSLEEEASALNEVVITALGIKKEKKKLGYALQEVKGEDLVKAREPNILGQLLILS